MILTIRNKDMKRLIASILTISVAASVITGCNKPTVETTVTTRATETTAPAHRVGPRHNLNNVDDSLTFEDTYIEYDGTPWAEQHDLNFVTGNIETDFVRIMLDTEGNEYDNSPFHAVETITKPTVKTYPSDRDGYVVHEINYSVDIPVDVWIPGSYLNSFDIYRSVKYIDYYTGYCYPTIRMTNDTLSTRVSGNVIYNGETYFVEFYQFNETTYPEDYSTIGDVYSEWHQTVHMDITSYFIVPRGYNGITMYVNVGEITTTYADVLVWEPVFPSKILGEGEDEDYFDNYEFIALIPMT